MLRTVYRDHERYSQQYWSQLPGIYFTGDGARRDEDGYFWVMGRVDDVRTYNRALTAAEVKQLYQLGTTQIAR
jgi:acyl-coenzyme A synthetase/AMP-(fatty) acid ligase